MQKLWKKTLPVIALTISLTILLNMGVTGGATALVNSQSLDDFEPYNIMEKINVTLSQSTQWLKDTQKVDGSWGDEQLINDTCFSVWSLNNNGEDTTAGVNWLNNMTTQENSDTLSHRLFATQDSSAYSTKLLQMQNTDGGFGVQKKYTSEPYDTVLALEALENLAKSEYKNNIEKMFSYLISVQNSDGGWGCNEYNDSDKALTGRIAYDIVKYLKDSSVTSQQLLSSVSKASSFLSGTEISKMTEDSFDDTLYYCLLKQQQGNYTDIYDVVEALSASQSENGSFFNSYYDTYLAIKYLNEIDTIDTRYTIEGFAVQQNKTNVYVNTSEELTAQYSIEYNTAVNRNLTMMTIVYDNDKSIYSQETALILDRDNKAVKGDALKYTVNQTEEKVLKIVSTLMDGEKEVDTYTSFVYVQEKPIEPKTEVTGAGVKLSDESGYIGEEKKITAEYYLLYSTNVNYTLTVKTYVYCGDKIITDAVQQEVLTPNNVSAEKTFAELNIKEENNATYKFVAEFYDGDRLMNTSVNYYNVYSKPKQDDTKPVEENNVITQFNVNLDSYCLYTSSIKQNITAKCSMLYSFVQDADITVKGSVLDGEKVMAENSQTIAISKDATALDFDLVTANELDISAEKEYTFKAEIYDSQNNFIGERKTTLKIQIRPKATLTLTADTTTGKDYGINLSWNDISSTDEQYGYRVLRSEDDGKTWETRSTWDGSEKVRVLNVHPTPESEPYLKKWMNTVVNSQTGETAGKGLFDISTVYLDYYNNDPEKYLFDSNGKYKYDVIVIGTAQGNGYKDFSQKSQIATQKFIDTGRGVLFGHDSVCNCNECKHEYLASFAEQLGIKVTSNGSYRRVTTVNVVNQGFLTSYPWVLSGTLTIPATHTYGQYTGGTLEGTVWMELVNAATNVDSETGATNNAYLVTNNQLALIMTGDSPGQATSDECKVFANTLFYLKQLTSNTTAQDNSFYDKAMPQAPQVDVTLTQYSRDSYSVSTRLASQDIGTQYKYRAEAIPRSQNSENVMSNTAVTEAFSDLKGFVVVKTDSADSAADKIEYEADGITVSNVISANNGAVTYDMDNLEKNKRYYLHIFAVDNANNISEETIKEICDSEEILSQAVINSNLSCDKQSYTRGDDVKLTASAYTTGSSLNTTADIQLCDLNGNSIYPVTNNINAQLTSSAKWSENYTFNSGDLEVGRYMAIITWYIAGAPVAQGQCLVRIEDQSEATDVTLTANVRQGSEYSNTLNWTDLNTDDGQEGYTPTDFSIVVDTSGSMSGNRIKYAKQAISNFINLMNDGDRTNIIRFTGSATLVTGFSDDKEMLNTAVGKLSATGGTSVSSGLNMSMEKFSQLEITDEKRNKAVILICDGDINNCDSAINMAVENDITIYTLNVVNSDSTVLQSFADKTGGKYYYTDVITDMTEILQYIKLMNDKGDYYYQVQRDGKITDAVTKAEYVDKDFLDTASPIVSSAALTAVSLDNTTYSGYITVKAEDKGTQYDYSVKAVNKQDEGKVINSNTVTAAAVSGVKGYYCKIDENSAATPEILTDENCFVSGNEELKIDVRNYQRGVMYYMHTYAIDNAGNISAEKTYPFVIGTSFFNGTNLTTKISTDKGSYKAGETAVINVSAKADFYKKCAKGVVEIYDKDDNPTDIVESCCIAEITSYEDFEKQFVWDVKDMAAGNYKATIKWYDGDTILAMDSTGFSIEPNGKITDNVSTDKLIYKTNEYINICDNILNGTTNTFADKLVLDVNISNVKAPDKTITKLTAPVSSFAGGIYNYSDYIPASDLGAGEYIAVSQVKDGDSVVASSSASFTVVEITQLNEKYIGELTVTPSSDKDKLFDFNVTNVSNGDGKDLKIRASVYNTDGEFMGSVERSADIAEGKTVNYSELFNTEALKIGNYPVILTVVSMDGKEAVLDYSGFEINVINKYTVTFMDDDGSVLDIQEIEYGQQAVAPENPYKDKTQQYTYTFDCWDSDYSNITSDITVRATYKAQVNSYNVTFMNFDGNIINTQNVEYGQAAVEPTEEPKKQADGKYTYEFIGWDKSFSCITEDTILMAQFNAVEIPTELATEPKTEPQTQPVTESPTQTVTQISTLPAAGIATEGTTQAPTSKITAPVTQPTQEVRANNENGKSVKTGADAIMWIAFVMLLGFIVAFILSKLRKRSDI